MRRVHVPLGDRAYDIEIGAGILANAAETILSTGRYTSAVLLTHPRLVEPYAKRVHDQFEARGVPAHLIIVPAGERYKSARSAVRLYELLARHSVDRKGILVTLGGGVLGDLGGFVAATWLRGIAFAQIPTTLLSQVDASIGGKTGIDLTAGKNLVGAFHQPRTVLIDVETVSTLPARELRSGIAEVVKYGIIHDEVLFARLLADMAKLLRRDREALMRAISRSCEIKAEIVAADETEQGQRAILNFGHTIGHAIEAVTGYRRYKHGEAISIGMVSASLIGEEISITPGAVTQSILRALELAGLPIAFPPDISLTAIVGAARRDKKSIGGSMRFVLVPRIGCAQYGCEVDEGTIWRALERHRALPAAG